MKKLQRFVDAQSNHYESVVAELTLGVKRGHWMWYIFPQLAGLGSSSFAELYAIESIDEASRYPRHDLLGPRLHECTRLVIETKSPTIGDIFPYPDGLKFGSCMTLFAMATTHNQLFLSALQMYFRGQQDERTLSLLAGAD